MKVAIIGATGFVGRRVVDEALARGIQVTAIARQKKLPEHANLTVALGDVADTAAGGAVRGQDAVISAYNPAGAKTTCMKRPLEAPNRSSPRSNRPASSACWWSAAPAAGSGAGR